MAYNNVEVQVCQLEAETLEQRDEMADRAARVRGCKVLFRGVNDGGRPILIVLLSGDALSVQTNRLYGRNPKEMYPLARVDIAIDMNIS